MLTIINENIFNNQEARKQLYRKALIGGASFGGLAYLTGLGLNNQKDTSVNNIQTNSSQKLEDISSNN